MLKKLLLTYTLFVTFSVADSFYETSSLRYLDMLYHPSYYYPVVDKKTKKELVKLKKELTTLKEENERLKKVIDGLNDDLIAADKNKTPARLRAIAKLKQELHQGR